LLLWGWLAPGGQALVVVVMVVMLVGLLLLQVQGLPLLFLQSLLLLLLLLVTRSNRCSILFAFQAHGTDLQAHAP
jgi:hypothetical protein